MIRLRGMTWKHDRGLAPMLATAQRFSETHPDITIEWEARSLSEFGEAPVEHLAEQYDLVVLDHPYVGALARTRCFLALDEYLSADQIHAFAADSTGPSWPSYTMDSHQWALPIDAAAQVMGYRADLLEQAGVAVPRTWEEVLSVAAACKVSVPLFPLDAFLAFCSLCANAGDPAFAQPHTVVSRQTGEYALDLLRRLRDVALPEAPTMNPIALWDRMSTTNDVACCPLAFGYSNYARPGYRKHRLSFGSIPSAGHGPAGATLGGAGLAVSAHGRDRETALAYALWVASPECQRTLYVESGGQPGSRTAWIDDAANALAGNYFRSTLPVLENVWLRPRYEGFEAYQNRGAEIVARFLSNTITAQTALDELQRALPR